MLLKKNKQQQQQQQNKKNKTKPKESRMIFNFYARLLFCSCSYGALLGGPLGRRSSAINTYGIGNSENRVQIISSKHSDHTCHCDLCIP